MPGRMLLVPALMAAWALWPGVAAGSGEESRPIESGLTERSARRLVQIDVSVEGPADAIRGLEAGDFELIVNGHPIDSFVVDRLCEPPGAPPGGKAEAGTAAGAPAVPADASTTFLFYFDQHHLTGQGRQNAMEIARELVPELVSGGSRAMIVSVADRVETFAEPTGNTEALLEAIDRLERDRGQWGGIEAFEEELRQREVVEIINDGDISRALSVARGYAKQEAWRTDKGLRRLSMVLGRLTDADPPKVVVYFADTMRRNPGEHFLSFFGRAVRGADSTEVAGDQIAQDAFMGGLPFERVIDEAASHGIRVYPVHAEGLMSESSRLHVTAMSTGGPASAPNPNQRASRDAQDSLVGLAQETGGQAFINGVPAAKIARTILEDLACVYLVSFEPGGLPEDQPLPVLVRVDRQKVRASARGRLVIQSERTRLTSRLFAAFGAPHATVSDFPLFSVLIPTGFGDGHFTALVQVAAPGSPLHGTTWDLGASLVARGEVREDVSGHVEVSGSGVPVVLERQMAFTPGPYELVAVAHETTGDQVGTSRVDGEWPDPDAAEVTLSPIAVVQPRQAVFLRGERLRRQGARGLHERELAHTDLPTVLVGLVCRSKAGNKPLRVERRITGDTAAEFELLELEATTDRCVQFRDVLPPDTMSPGLFRYEVRVQSAAADAGDEPPELARAVREFAVVAPGDGDGRASSVSGGPPG